MKSIIYMLKNKRNIFFLIFYFMNNFVWGAGLSSFKIPNESIPPFRMVNYSLFSLLPLNDITVQVNKKFFHSNGYSAAINISDRNSLRRIEIEIFDDEKLVQKQNTKVLGINYQYIDFDWDKKNNVDMLISEFNGIGRRTFRRENTEPNTPLKKFIEHLGEEILPPGAHSVAARDCVLWYVYRTEGALLKKVLEKSSVPTLAQITLDEKNSLIETLDKRLEFLKQAGQNVCTQILFTDGQIDMMAKFFAGDTSLRELEKALLKTGQYKSIMPPGPTDYKAVFNNLTRLFAFGALTGLSFYALWKTLYRSMWYFNQDTWYFK